VYVPDGHNLKVSSAEGTCGTLSLHMAAHNDKHSPLTRSESNTCNFNEIMVTLSAAAHADFDNL